MSSRPRICSSTVMSTLSGSPTKPRSTTSSPGAEARVHLARGHHVAVLAAEADRPPALRVDRADDLLVDRAGEHHLDDLDRRLVGDAQAAGEARFDAELLQHRADLRPAAVHDDRIDARLLEQHHVAREVARLVLVAHGVAAVFDHDDRVVIAQHVRQRLHQDFGLCCGLALRASVMVAPADRAALLAVGGGNVKRDAAGIAPSFV